ncbi:MAG: polysaccharide biosynthesis/export protein [Sphingomonadales bacterium]|jgi:polysaccharide export outer membrane protein|nr:polysaccharide biosynthesis/export protein [Sphingomonadales bacterium]
MQGALLVPSCTPRRLWGLFPLLGLLSLAACADTRGGSIPYDKPLAAPDETRFQTLASDYKIAPMDKLAIKIFKMQDLTGDYDVDLAGNISLPLIGELQAANLTTAQLDEQLTQKLGDKYLEHPDVSVAIKSSTAHVVTVDGAVKDGGSFPVGGPTSLIRAIAMAKGTTEDANARRVAVFRTIGGKRQAAAFDLTSVRRGEAPDPEIFPGDIIVVDGSRVKAVQKQLLQSIPLLAIFGPL